MSAPGSRPLALVGGNVWDATRAEPASATVLIKGERIAAVGPDVAVPDDAERIDAAGRTVMPGLIDMHVHVMLCGEDSLLGFLGTGVTSVRDVGGDPDVLLPMREALAAGQRVGPRLFVYGPMLDGDPSIFGRAAAGLSKLTRVSATVDEGVSTVRELLERGVDGIKLYAGLRPDLVEAMIKAADHRVPVAAHLGRTWASEAIDAGVDTLEHVHATLYQDVVRPEDRHSREGGNGAMPNYWTWLTEGWARADLDADYVARFIDKIVSSEVAVSPTTVLCTGGMCTMEAADEPGQVYRPRQMTERTRQGQERMQKLREAAEREGRELPARRAVDPELGQRAKANELEFLHRLHSAGGSIAPGTDVGAAPLQVPGFSLHRELALLVEGGLPNADVLAAATRGAAALLRSDAELGTLEPGKRADVLVIDGDPLTDIHATRKVEHVVKDGRLHRPQELLDLIVT